MLNQGPLKFLIPISQVSKRKYEIWFLQLCFERTSLPEIKIQCSKICLFSKDYLKRLVSQKQPLEVFCKKRFSQKLHKIHRKAPVPESFLIKLPASVCNFIRKEILEQVFSCEFFEIFKNTFFTDTSSGCFWYFLFKKLKYANMVISLI